MLSHDPGRKHLFPPLVPCFLMSLTRYFYFIHDTCKTYHLLNRSLSSSLKFLSTSSTQKAPQVMTTTTNSLNIIEKSKATAARLAVDENIDRDCIVGIGSGTTMPYVLERLVLRCKEKNLSIKCIPTSFQAKQLLYQYTLPVTEIECNPVIDVTIDGVDEMDENFVAIKGGGACLTQEKIVAFAAKKFITVADHRKNSKHLGDNWKKGIPIEVLPMACNAVRRHISLNFHANIDDIVIRVGKEKAGPVITDNGNFILDWRFDIESFRSNSIEEWRAIADSIKLIPGVVETGIFAGMIKIAYFGQVDGGVTKKEAQ